MISCDTNILFAACDADNPLNVTARTFLQEHGRDQSFAIAEQVLMELYVLLRNPTISRPPLNAGDAAALISRFRANPSWRIVDVPTEGEIMNELWRIAAQTGFAYRRIFDVRLALTLRHHGITALATANIRDFADLGFERVWNPLSKV
ncbi:MAG: TA system VapC family ribonuclease toxin [bacterium]